MAQQESGRAAGAPGEGQEQRGKYFIRTFGCQMNVADSERMAALLTEQGLDPTDNPKEAEVILINGCTVREKAVHKAVSTLGITAGASAPERLIEELVEAVRST